MRSYWEFVRRRFQWAKSGVWGHIGNVSLITGLLVAILAWCFPDWTRRNISDRMNAFVLGIIPLAAGGSVLLVRWLYSSYAVFGAENDKRIELEKRANPRIRVSCGRSVDKSVVKEVDGKRTWFRARLDLLGDIPIPDIDPNVTELREDGKKVQLQELLNLTMYPGLKSPVDSNLRTLYPGRPEFVDVISSTSDGKAGFPLKWYHGSVPYDTLIKPNHAYEIVVVLTAPSHPTVTCCFEFRWTGDPDKSEIRLLDVKPLPS
jgi:hypothetical protein